MQTRGLRTKKRSLSHGERSEAYRWMHHRAAMEYRAKGSKLIYAAIIGSFVAGLLSLATAQQSVPGLNYVVSFFSIASAALTAIEQFENPRDEAAAHEQAADNFAVFYRGVNLELSLNPEERRAFLDFMQMAKADYERLVTTSPTLPDGVVDEYRLRFKHRRNQPEIVAADIGRETGEDVHVGTYQHQEAGVTQNDYDKIRELYNQKYGKTPSSVEFMMQRVDQTPVDQEIEDLENQISQFH